MFSEVVFVKKPWSLKALIRKLVTTQQFYCTDITIVPVQSTNFLSHPPTTVIKLARTPVAENVCHVAAF